MKHKILVVEDQADTRNAFGLRLRSAGFDVAFAADGIQAVSATLREKPDLVLLDLGLPGGDGFTVLARLRELPATSALPVVVVSARDAEANRDRAASAGAVAYLEKPVDGALLLTTIRRNLPRPAATSPRVLVIEDDVDTRRALLMRLTAAGFETSSAADATTGFGAALKVRPDAILLDLGLPAGDGIALIGRLRSHKWLSGIPVFVLSARPASTTRQLALDAGAADYFEKPPDNDRLLAALRRVTRASAEPP